MVETLAPQFSASGAVHAGRVFPPTRWSLVRSVRESGEDGAGEALEMLCRDYWQPIYTFLRREGHGPHDAEDLTQSFLASMASRQIFGRAEPELGKLRTFLLANLRHFLANERRAATRQKRGGAWQAVPLDTAAVEPWLDGALAHDENPARAFDRAWVLALIRRVLAQLQEEYAQAGKAELYARLRPFLIEVEGGRESAAAAAAALGMSDGALRAAAHRMRVRYRELLLQTVADTVDGPKNCGTELDYLLQLFR